MDANPSLNPDGARLIRNVNHALLLGLIVGLVFGLLNVLFTWLYPLADDAPGALLRFYGPLFFVWALASFHAARRTGRLSSGVATGLTIAVATFCAFDLLILVRVNLFLNELTGRADWQNMMMRFRASDIDSLRLFVNLDYIKGAPLKLGVSCAIGVVMGGIGGFSDCWRTGGSGASSRLPDRGWTRPWPRPERGAPMRSLNGRRGSAPGIQ